LTSDMSSGVGGRASQDSSVASFFFLTTARTEPRHNFAGCSHRFTKLPSLPQRPLQPLLTKLCPPLVGTHTAQLLPLLLLSSSSCGQPPGHPPCQPTHMIKSVGDSHRGPLNNRENPTFFRKKQNTNELTTIKHTRNNHDPAAGAHGHGGPSSPPE
jgi:hypothetical protein